MIKWLTHSVNVTFSTTFMSELHMSISEDLTSISVHLTSISMHLMFISAHWSPRKMCATPVPAKHAGIHRKGPCNPTNKNRTIGPWLIWEIHEIRRISWNPTNFMHEIRRISSWNPADFRPWNPADFMKSSEFHHEIWQISGPEIRWISWNLADFICKLPHLHMKSGRFHEIWWISSMKSGGFHGWSWKMQTWKCKFL